MLSQLEMSPAWVCVEWGCSNPNSLSTMILKHFQFRILLVESCHRMPPRKKTELAPLVLRAFPALRAALWTCSQQRKVWCRRSSWKAQKEYSKFTKTQNLPPQLLPMHLSTLYPQAALLAAGKKSFYIQVLVNTAMDTWPISCPDSYQIKPLRWYGEALSCSFSGV